jgi:NAD(P)-dependent dehydrogenase (short-subunit alcohol dehydrogenase family)
MKFCTKALTKSALDLAVLITGTSTGIGFDASLELARRGYTVFAGVRRIQDGTRLVHAACNTTGLYPFPSLIPGSIVPLILDISSATAISQAVELVAQRVARDNLRFMGVVNNAAISLSIPLELTSDAELRRVFDVNVFGTVAVTNAFLPLLRASGRGGKIVTVGSVAAIAPLPGFGPYSMTKAALESWSDVLRAEVSDQGIFVSLIQSGTIHFNIITNNKDA